MINKDNIPSNIEPLRKPRGLMGEKQGRSFNRAPSSFASVGYHVNDEFVVPAWKTMKANRGGDLGSNVTEEKEDLRAAKYLLCSRDTHPGGRLDQNLTNQRPRIYPIWIQFRWDWLCHSMEPNLPLSVIDH